LIWFGLGSTPQPMADESPALTLSPFAEASSPAAALSAAVASDLETSPSRTGPPSVPSTGNGRFDYASTGAERVGDSSHLVHYLVATEQGSHVDPEVFAAAVQQTLGDRRSWIAGGKFSFQRVPAGSPSELTVHLATPSTTDSMCAKRGVRTRGEVSCRGGRDVIINLKRWLLAVAWYPSVAEYRNMVVNHEVGHFLGNGHAVCPRKGAPAPVMARQSLGLEGCVANAWPYPDGQHFVTGPPAPR
jgi:hypothetical protein